MYICSKHAVSYEISRHNYNNLTGDLALVSPNYVCILVGLRFIILPFLRIDSLLLSINRQLLLSIAVLSFLWVYLS